MSFVPGLPDDSVNVTPTHPLREAALLVAGIIGVAVLLVVVLAAAAELLVPMLPPGLEARIFSPDWLPGADEEEEEIEPRTEQVQALVDRLASHWPENPYRFRAAVLDEDAANAFALPGGWIAVTRGLLEESDSENELAFVLGHEIGHFAGRHHLSGLGRGLAMGVVLSAFSASGAGGAAHVAVIAGQLATRSFDREQESRADGFGLVLLAAEYGHVGGAADFFERAPQGDGIGEQLAGYLATHPLDDERIGALEELARQRGWAVDGPLAPLPDAG